MSNIQALAIAAGLQHEWQDAGGRRQTVSDDALRTILDRLGHPSENEKQIADSLAAIAARNARGGRFLSVPAPDEHGMLLLDFNRAYNPPCAFSPYTTCPLPLPGNVLPLSIEAGERAPLSSATR